MTRASFRGMILKPSVIEMSSSTNIKLLNLRHPLVNSPVAAGHRLRMMAGQVAVDRFAVFDDLVAHAARRAERHADGDGRPD